MEFIITVHANKELHHTGQEWAWEVHEGLPSENNQPIRTGLTNSAEHARYRAERWVNQELSNLVSDFDFGWDGSARYIYEAQDTQGPSWAEWQEANNTAKENAV